MLFDKSTRTEGLYGVAAVTICRYAVLLPLAVCRWTAAASACCCKCMSNYVGHVVSAIGKLVSDQVLSRLRDNKS